MFWFVFNINKYFFSLLPQLGSNSSLKIEIDEPEIEALEFLILDEARNKWSREINIF